MRFEKNEGRSNNGTGKAFVPPKRAASALMEPVHVGRLDTRRPVPQGAESRNPLRIAAYLSEFSPARGVARLLHQRDEILTAATRLESAIFRFYCDSGRPDGLVRRGAALSELVSDAFVGVFDVVLVLSFGCLSEDFGVATAAEADLAAAGVALLEAEDGGLENSGALTVFGRPRRLGP
jgi:hypothetical protein